MKWRFDNYHDSFSILLGGYLCNRGILLSEITEAVFMVKASRVDVDASSLVDLRIGSGLSLLPDVDPSKDSVVVTFDRTSFGPGALEVTPYLGEPYKMGLGIKTASMTTFLEVDIKDEDLIIYPDFIHD